MIFGSEREIGKLGKQLKCIGHSHNEDSTIPNKESSNLLCLWSLTKIKAEVFMPNMVRGFKPTCIILTDSQEPQFEF